MALGEYLGAGTTVIKGLYHLNGDATDSSGNGNNGTATNITWVGGKLGSGAASFNGSSSKIVTNNAVINSLPMTISFWFNITAKPTGDDLMNFMSDASYDAQGWFIDMYASSGKVRVFVLPYSIENYSFSNFDNGVWYNMVVTWSTTSQKLYINGKLVDSSNKAVTYTPSTGVFALGVRNSAGDRFFNGKMDEVILENALRTSEQVKKYYTHAKGRFIN